MRVGVRIKLVGALGGVPTFYFTRHLLPYGLLEFMGHFNEIRC